MSRRFKKKSARARGKRSYKGSALEAYNLARKAGKKYKRGKRGGKRRAKAYARKKRRGGKYRRSGAPRAKKYGLSARGVLDRRFAGRIADQLRSQGYAKSDAKHLAMRYVEREHALKRAEAEAAAKARRDAPMTAAMREEVLSEVAKSWAKRHKRAASAPMGEGLEDTFAVIADLEKAAKSAR